VAENEAELRVLVESAEGSIARAAVLAEADPRRPVFHFRAPGQWMDDPNGIIHDDGVYHVMYSLNPHSATQRAGMVYKTAERVWDPTSADWTGGITVWGHARSRDLVHWEHLPIAIVPQIDRGEHFVWFGCTVIRDDGTPMAIYTSVGPDLRPEDSALQWAALGDRQMLRFTPMDEALLDYDVHGGAVLREWRDPFVFVEDGTTYLVLGAQEDAGDGPVPVVALYQALDAALTRWQYRGIVFRRPGGQVPSAECPNLFRVGDHWVLLVSPHGPVEWYVGSLDLESATFVASSQGMVDHSDHFYATNMMRDADPDPIVWAAVEGFSGTSHWNGALSLPRRITVVDGRLRQRPSPEFEELRSTAIPVSTVVPSGHSDVLGTTVGGVLDLDLVLDREPGSALALTLRSDGSELTVSLDGTEVEIAGTTFTLDGPPGGEMPIRVVVDRTLVEVFLGEADCYTHVAAEPFDEVVTSLTAVRGTLSARGTLFQLEAEGLFTTSPELEAVRAEHRR